MSAVDQGLDAAVQRVMRVNACGLMPSGCCYVHLEVWHPDGYCTGALDAARAAREDVPALTQQARADAWDEGWAKLSDWYHANAIGESHTVDPTNPYGAAAIREGREP